MSTNAATTGVERVSSSHSSQEKSQNAFNKKDESEGPVVRERPVSEDALSEDDDARLERMGYKNEFKREFKSLSTFSFAMSIMGLISSVITTWNTPYFGGGGPSVIWTWFMGSIMNMTLGIAIGELVSAYPSCGGLYSVSGLVVPRQYSAVVAYGVGWANGLGQIAGISGTAYGLASMIASWAYVITDGSWVATTGEIVGIYIAIMIIAGAINSFPTSWLARLTSSYVFVNIITTIVVAILVVARTPDSERLTGKEAFGTIENQSGWTNSLGFLLGLQMVQFVMTDYDATAHISEEVSRAAVAAPVAIVEAIACTGILGWFLNICLVFASSSLTGTTLEDWPGELAVAQIMLDRGGKIAFLIVWPFACAVAFFVIVTATQANGRSFYALARDGAIPRWFAVVDSKTGVTLNAVWLVVLLNIVLVMLAFINYAAVAAIFSLAALGMDLSYWVPILCRQIFANHPDVQFHQARGPFYLGQGILSKAVNWIAIVWTLFEVTILCIPTANPVTALTMNWASVVFFGVLIPAYAWYFIWGHRYYISPAGASHRSEHSVISRADEK